MDMDIDPEELKTMNPKPRCPSDEDGDATHTCWRCGEEFYCLSAYLGDAVCTHEDDLDEDDNLRYVCTNTCKVLNGYDEVFYQSGWLSIIDYKRQALVNRAKLCDCDLFICCDDESGCWSPRPFALEE